jgi:hypothetical protein
MSAWAVVACLWPRWAQMWTLALALYSSCKWLTWHGVEVGAVPRWKRAAYLLAWPGLDAPRFLEVASTSASHDLGVEAGAALAKLMVGLALLFGLARRMPEDDPYLVGWIGMIGIVLILHFGLLHLLSCLWRRLGLEARPLMNRPLRATSLGEFWGRRWNTAFRDLTHRFLFRPCAARLGPQWGLLAGFLVSGLIHELVISLPARGGYGGPTAFFAIQGAAVAAERSRLGARLGLGAAWRGRAFAIVVLGAPLGWLFPRPFVVGIVVPFMRALGAL